MSAARRQRRLLARQAGKAAVASVMSQTPSKIRAAASAASSPPRGAITPTAARKLPKLSDRLEIVGEIDKKSAASLRESLAALGSKKDVGVFLNSEGGSCTQGIEMYHALRRHEGKVVATVDGLAASMASVILQAADERHVSRGSYVMIHNPSAGTEGEASDLRGAADLLDKIRSDMLDIYEASTGLGRDKIAKMMDEETYLTADEAVKLGFADIVDETEARIDVKAVARLSEKSKKIPEALRAKAKEKTMDEEEEKALRAKLKALEEENAKLKAKAEEDDDSDDGEEASAEGDDTPHDEDDDKDDDEKKEAKGVLRAAMRLTGKKSAAEIEGALMALSHGVVNARAVEVDGLVKAGKLAPKDKAWALKTSDKAFAAYKNAIGSSTVLDLGRVKQGKPADGTDATGLTDEEKAYMKASGFTEQQIIDSRKFSALGKAH